MKNLVRKISCLLIALFITALNFSAPAFALKEKTWDKFDLNYIYYYDPDGEECNPSSGSVTAGDNTLYNGEPILSADALAKIAENRPFYEKAANKYGLSWQLLAALHFRESHTLAFRGQ